MIDILIGVLVLAGVGAFVWFKVVKPKLDKERQGVAPPEDVRASYPIGARYTPPAAPVTDNASGQAFRDSLAPSTRAHMRDGPYFDAQGRPLDVAGNTIKPAEAPSGPLPGPAATPEIQAARDRLEKLIRTGGAYSIADIQAAGMRHDGVEFSNWHYAIKRSMGA